MNALTLTEKIRTVDAITELSTEFGYSPTVREIADRIGRSVSATHDRLAVLEAEGRITRNPTKPRTLRVP